MAAPNVVDLEVNSGGRRLVITLTVFIFFDFVFICTRFYARRIKKKYLEINDWAILVGFIFLLATYALQIVQVVHNGLGMPVTWIVTNLGIPRVQTLFKCTFASNILWNVCIMAIKLSILHLYLSLFSSVRTMKRLVFVTMVLTVITHTAFIIEVLSLCRPLAYFWHQGLTAMKGTCPSGKQGQIARFVPGLLSLLLDIVIFVLPIPLLWTLRMPTTKKIATTAVFGVGFGIVIVAAVRLRYIFEEDSTIEFAITGAVEPMVGIMVCCTPMLQPVISHITGGRISLWASRRSTKNPSLSAPSSWPQHSQKSYASGAKAGKTRTHERMGDEDELIEMDKRSGPQTPEDGGNWISVVEEGGIRITRDVLVDTRPKSSKADGRWK
ncbi:hypothetical protein EJ04DRAFT_579379 [Polyplosphaeria fusca]|uniref:Rhodopsin domain-containing protein n=1 Tax=Polyplosphaeria fusca TaxID=682080 RepID=A0A9P4QP94_9PLEO|nr:hypothetical protein EJ04DRAFT_579379 [Polyplosphaeria fusca]